MCSWLQAAVDLNIRCAAIFDDDSAGQSGLAEALKRFGNNPLVRLAMLPAADIRDKLAGGDKTTLQKIGVFDRDRRIKSEVKPIFDKLLQDISSFLWSP
jgi:hypothetical protein